MNGKQIGRHTCDEAKKPVELIQNLQDLTQDLIQNCRNEQENADWCCHTCEKAKKPVPWLRLVRPPASLPCSKAMLVSMSRFLCLLRPPEEPVKATDPTPDLALPRLSAPELVTVLPWEPWELPPRFQPLLILFISPP